jgi:hypothetical protein
MAEVAQNDEAGPDVSEIDDRADAPVPWRVFGFVGGFIGVITAIYWFTSYEEAGSAMLAVAAVLGLWISTYLWRNLRRFEAGGHGEPSGEDATMYLPEASPWPFGIGLGVALVLNGLLIGSWFLVPGVMVLAVSLAGFARQSRHRR